MKHYMNLYSDPFNKILNGEKTIELRLYDKKRQKISIGDTIIFTDKEDENLHITAEVVNIYKFGSFEELYKALPSEKCGYKKGEKADPSDMEFYYPKEVQKHYGVIGIEIKVLQ